MKKIIILIIALAFSFIETNGQCNDRPIINDFTPQTGFIGSTVTITGANFSAIPSENQVFFGATEASIVSSTFGTLEVRVPEGSTTALISVKNKCNLSAYSKTHFNGVFCPTPLTNTSYQNTSQELPVSYGAYNMVSQDMDNDGKPDMVIAGLNGGLSIAKNNSTPGNINFSSYNFPSNTRTIAVADFDGDGFKDLATNYNIIKNTSTGPGVFGLAIAISDSRSVSGYQIGVGDFNNDGKIDIIGSAGSGIYVAFNTSTGPGNFNFTTRQFVGNAGTQCTGIQIADVDGDGKADFLGSQGSSNRAVSIRNTTPNGSMTASFETPEFWSSDSDPSDGTGTYPYRAMIADFDKDGKIDFTSCNFRGSANVAIWRNISTVGNITFAPTINLPSPGSNYRIGVGDVDGDGYPDVVTKSSGANIFSVYKNTTSNPGNVTFNARLDFTSSARAEVSGLAIGDLDGDFVPDIATSGISSRTIRFHRNTGAQNDVTAPTVSCKNIVVALSPAGTVTITPEMIDNGSGDACGIESLVLSQTDFTCADIGENTVILTATDGAGNQSSCTATVNVQPAAIIVVGQTTVCQGETISASANIGDSYQWKKDGINIPGATTQNYVATTSGDYTVEVTNAGGCSGESIATSFVVNENPTVDISPAGNAFICGPNGTTQLTATQSSIYQWIKNGVDIANATQQTYDATSVGTYSVRVIDLFGCSAVSEPTTITADPAEIVVSGTGNYGNVFPNQNYTQTITISNTGTGTLDITNLTLNGADTSSFSLAGFSSPGSIPAGGTTAVDVIFNAPNITTYSAVLSFNSNDCDEDFISIPLNAEITCVAAAFSAVPSNISVNNDAGICGATVNYTAEATGNPISTITYSFTGDTEGSGNGTGTNSLFNIGITTVTINATNPCGNVTESFEIVVADNEAPVTPVLADVTGECTATATAPTTTDNCAGTINGTTSDPLTYAAQGTHVITWTFDDGNGNVITANQNVIVNDTTDPNTPTLADVIVQCEASVEIATTTDNCAGIITGTTSDLLTYSAQGAHVITWSFDDGNGNVITANQNVIVNDTIAPIAVAQDITVTLDEFGSATITADDIDNGSSDNCTFTLSIDVTTFDCTNIDINNTVTLTVTDAAGNTDVTTANVSILEHFKDTLDLRSLGSFEAFTGTGAITNAGAITGDVGTNAGALTGFTSTSFIGNVYFNDALTTQADIDLMKVYIHLNNIFETYPGTHAPAFGSGETLYPGVYSIGGAGSVAGTLTLDGQGDPNAVFILKFKGAFTAGAATNINLTNGADAANVYWVAQGALSVGANSTIKGTLLAYPGAITLGVNSSIEGRLLSSVGAITVAAGGTAIMPAGIMNIPINPMVSYTPAAAVDVLGSIENFSLFTSNGAVSNASTSGILGDVGADVGAITGFATSAIIGSYYNADAVTAQAKIDLNNAYTQLMLIPNTVSSHTPAFGSGETLLAGVYTTAGAGSLAGTITLDGQNNPDAIFIFKFNGAFAAGAQSRVILSNGTRRCNVFWISEGAASIGSFSTIKGTVIANNAAATMGAGGNLEGRLLSTGGAIGFSTSVVYTVVHDVECSNITAPKTAVKTAADTAITSFEEELQVYPNPSKGIFNIKLAIFNVDTEIYLFDTTGKLIARKSISKENNSGNMIAIGNNNLSSGIYLVKIITKNETVTKKVIVEKSH